MNQHGGKYQKWEVWNFDQSGSRNNSNPKQPNDSSKSYRPFLIIAPGSTPYGFVTCCPLQDVGTKVVMSQVRIPNQYGGFIRKDCKVLCHDIFTLEKSYFRIFLGVISDLKIQEDVENALLNHLGL